MTMTEKDAVPFDSVIKALTFAFNAGEDFHIASPVMNRAMAEIKVKKKLKKVTAEAAQLLAPEPKGGAYLPKQPGESLKGWNKALQAGFILQVVRRLDAYQVNLLAARFIRPTAPCQCQNLCCQGFRVTPRWGKALDYLCLHLKDDANIVGKDGLSTEPFLRKLVVERYFLNDPSSIAHLARRAKVSHITATKHANWIQGYLEKEETEAMEQVALLFDQEKITGLIE